MVIVNHKRLKASSLVETLTAMVIITIAFSAGFMIFSNVAASGRSTLRMRAKQSALQYVAEIKSKRNFIDQNTNGEGFQLQSRFQAFHDATDVQYMQIVARTPDNRILYQHHELIYGAQQ